MKKSIFIFAFFFNGLTNTNTVMNYIFINDNKLRVYPKDEYISNINGISNMIFNRD